ncbi:MAG: hypothetical protein H0V89_06605 [Deltaproteobacteria bacterium]|nr:hypothetical protein [Deltaproteobacteria bacterium]
MAARTITTASIDDTILDRSLAVEDVDADLGAAVLHLVAHHRLRGLVTGAYLGNGSCYVWSTGQGDGMLALGRDGRWHPVDDIHVPDLGSDPVLATRRWRNLHEGYEAVEGYVLESNGSRATLRAGCWAWSPERHNLVDAVVRRWGVPEGVAYVGLTIQLRDEDAEPDDGILDRPLSDLHLPKRVVNYLFRHSRITTVRELLALSRTEVERLPGMGLISAREVDEALGDHGLHLPWEGRRPQQPVPAPASVRTEPLVSLGLAPKSSATMAARGLATIGDLVGMTLADLLRVDGVGPKMANEIRDALGRRGLKLKVYERGHSRPPPGDPTVPVEELWIAPHIGYRKTRTLRAAGIETVGDLTRVTAEDLLVLPKFGSVSVRSIREWMAGLGFKLKGE